MVAGHVPAWRKLGLKLKSEEQLPANAGQGEDAAYGPALKKRKLDGSSERVKERINGTPAASEPTITSRKSAVNKADIANTEAAFADHLAPAGNMGKRTALSDSPGDNNPPRRKSVTFSSDTKTTDGSSAKRIPHEVASSRLSRLSGVDATEIAAATRELNAMSSPTAVNRSSDPTKKAKTKKKGKRKSQGASATSLEESGPTRPKRQQNLLDYLDNYHTSRSSWKFNKIYQTLLFKKAFNLSAVPLSYNDALYAYIAGLQGDSIREKLHSEAKEIIDIKDNAAVVGAMKLQDAKDHAGVKEKMERAQRAQVVKEAVEESWNSFGRNEVKKKAELKKGDERPDEKNAKAGSGAGVQEDEKEMKGAVKKKRKRIRKRRTDVESDSSSSSSSSSSDSDNDSEV